MEVSFNLPPELKQSEAGSLNNHYYVAFGEFIVVPVPETALIFWI